MKYLLTLLFALSGVVCFAEEHPQKQDSLSVDEVRTQSGVDPTRITSRIGFSTWLYDKQANNAQINNRFSVSYGVNDWSFQVRTDIVSVNTEPGGKFTTGIGNLKFGILNSFYTRGQHALAASLDFVSPIASRSISTAAGLGSSFYSTISLTYSYTITPSVMFAVQPQYSFSLATAQGVPHQNSMLVRFYFAKFTSSGFYFVLEPRPTYDFTNKQFDMIVSPIIGKALGAGYNLVVLAEIPCRKEVIEKTGVLYLVGVNRTF